MGRNDMDQLFDRFLPSASADQVESARWRILGRVRADAAANLQPVELAINYGDYHILWVLENGERHGYAIMSEVEQVTDGAAKFGPGTLYTSIRRLLKAGLIEESPSRPDLQLNAEPRRHFRLTGLGQKALAENSQRRTVRLRYAHGLQIVRA